MSADELKTMATFVAAGAAALAAGAAMFNVWLTARLNRRAALQDWRRDRIHPLVLAVQAASQRHSTLVGVMETLRLEGANAVGLKDEANTAFDELTRALDELEVVAPELFFATAQLRLHHRSLFIVVLFPDHAQPVEETTKNLGEARTRFLADAQRSLGIQRDVGTRRRPWRRMARLWRSLRRSNPQPPLARASTSVPAQDSEKSSSAPDSTSG